MSSRLFGWLVGTQPVEEYKPNEPDFLPELPLEDYSLALLILFIEKAVRSERQYLDRADKALRALSAEFNRRDELAFERAIAESWEADIRQSRKAEKNYRRRRESELYWDITLWRWGDAVLCPRFRPSAPFSRR